MKFFYCLLIMVKYIYLLQTLLNYHEIKVYLCDDWLRLYNKRVVIQIASYLYDIYSKISHPS